MSFLNQPKGYFMITNADRAECAQTAVDAFRAVCPTDREDAVKDLITNLLHLARREWAVTDAHAFAARCASMHDIEVSEDPEDDEDDFASEIGG